MMMMRGKALIISAALIFSAATFASAQEEVAPLPDLDEEQEMPPGATGPDAPDETLLEPETADQHKEMMDSLFDRLRDAKDEQTAEVTEQLIWNLWLYSGSDTVDVLMRRTLSAMKDENYPLALDLLNAIVELKPDYAEGWNKRATVFFLLRDYAHSMQDVEQVLALEPRHFGALTGLGMILRDTGDNTKALAAFRKALEVHPQLKAARSAVNELEDIVEGKDI